MVHECSHLDSTPAVDLLGGGSAFILKNTTANMSPFNGHTYNVNYTIYKNRIID